MAAVSDQLATSKGPTPADLSRDVHTATILFCIGVQFLAAGGLMVIFWCLRGESDGVERSNASSE